MFFKYLVVSCLCLVAQINWVTNADSVDKYRALEVDTFDISMSYRSEKKSEIAKLNEFMIDKTDSTDPNVNLDIVEKEFDSQLEKKVPFDDLSVQAKRLLLALRTLEGKDECNHYSYLILKNNQRAIKSPARAIKRNEGARRIDKVLAHYINKHIKNCRDQYFQRYDQIYSALDKTLLHRIDVLLNDAVKTITSDENERNAGKSYAKRLFYGARHGLLTSYVRPSYMYNVMVNSVKGSEEEKYMKKVENERTGYPALNLEVFGRVFRETVTQPCYKFRSLVGPDVFLPLLFDGLYHHEVQEERTDFYEALLKFQLCYFDYPENELLRDVVYYVEFGRE